ncbi:MAG: DUF72 domain-containing protein [Planctomycetota bacterium]
MDPNPPAEKRVRFGIAGWSYPDWEGIVYPRGLKDQLEYVSRYVDMVEVNSTFYRPPDERLALAWLRRTAKKPDFSFSAKIHQDVTHKGSLDPGLVRCFSEGLAPLVESGKLRHLLAQFRYDFADTPANRDHLARIREAFGALAEIVVEVRHVSWQSPAALAFLEGLGVTVANLDYPTSRTAFTLRECRVGANGYFRLHGRNRAAWFDKRAGRDETYDYLYSPEELEGIAARARELLRSFRSLSVVGNNHFRGKELANVLELKALISGEKVDVPEGLLAEYPRLAAIAREGVS